jgi:hypothetical protein
MTKVLMIVLATEAMFTLATLAGFFILSQYGDRPET